MQSNTNASMTKQTKRRKLIRLESIRTVRFGRRTDLWMEKKASCNKIGVPEYIRNTMDGLRACKSKN